MRRDDVLGRVAMTSNPLEDAPTSTQTAELLSRPRLTHARRARSAARRRARPRLRDAARFRGTLPAASQRPRAAAHAAQACGARRPLAPTRRHDARAAAFPAGARRAEARERCHPLQQSAGGKNRLRDQALSLRKPRALEARGAAPIMSCFVGTGGRLFHPGLKKTVQPLAC